MSARNWILKEACIQIGNAHIIDVQHDPWVPGIMGAVPKILLGPNGTRIKTVADLRMSEGGGQNEVLMRRLFGGKEAEQILAINQPASQIDDKLEVETLFHLFKECQGVKTIAFSSAQGFRIEEWDVGNISDIILHCIHPRLGIAGLFDKDWHLVFFSSFLYCCWFIKNNVVHEERFKIQNVVVLFNHMVEEGMRSIRSEAPLEDALGVVNNGVVLWSPPHAGWLKANNKLSC